MTLQRHAVQCARTFLSVSNSVQARCQLSFQGCDLLLTASAAQLTVRHISSFNAYNETYIIYDCHVVIVKHAMGIRQDSKAQQPGT